MSSTFDKKMMILLHHPVFLPGFNVLYIVDIDENCQGAITFNNLGI